MVAKTDDEIYVFSAMKNMYLPLICFHYCLKEARVVKNVERAVANLKITYDIKIKVTTMRK